MIWDSYVFRRGIEVEDLWDEKYSQHKKTATPLRILYIAGRGFDVRAEAVLRKFVDRIVDSGCQIDEAKLLLIGFSGYELASELNELTEKNAAALKNIFDEVGTTETIVLDNTAEGEDDVSATVALRHCADQVLGHVNQQSDVILDVSSLPRITFLTVLLSLLAKIIPQAGDESDLTADGVTLQVLVGEDPLLDSQISADDPSNDLVLIPGYSEGLQSEALGHEPLVWFPILGENREGQIRKIDDSIPSAAEICPVLPNPSRNPRRGDELVVEYNEVLFAKRETPLSNIIYAHEAHPFEVYRQLLNAMMRYRKSMSVIGNCRMVVTPLASKLITIGCALACFEMKRVSADHLSSISIPYAEPKRYTVDPEHLSASQPEISALILTGEAYAT